MKSNLKNKKNNLKDKYDFKLRLASREEVNDLATYLAKENWRDSQKHKTSGGVIEETEKEALRFIKKEKRNILRLIGGKVMAQEYKKFNVSIFVYNYIQEYDENTITSLTLRVLKTEKGLEKLDEDDVVFELNTLKNKPYREKRKKVGRPNRPSVDSVQKAIELKQYLEEHPTVNREYICKEFGFSKTTYYRVVKWLEHRHN